MGTTRIGSSGGPCFNKDNQLIGTLSGGAANCAILSVIILPGLTWHGIIKSDSARQLKHWLDPLGSNPVSFHGKQFNSGEQLCKAYTNLKEGDTHRLLKTTNPAGGYWSGTNKDGSLKLPTSFRFPEIKTSRSFVGIGKKFQLSQANNSYITLKVYNLNGKEPCFNCR